MAWPVLKESHPCTQKVRVRRTKSNVCGFGLSRQKAYEASMKALNIVVVGNGMVGHHFVDQLALSDVNACITVLGSETRPAYDRVHLSEVCSGKAPSDLALTTRE